MAIMIHSMPVEEIVQGVRIDWERVILDIQRSTWMDGKSDRYSNRSIARACGRGENWVWNLKNIPNTEPKFHDAIMLLALWAEKTGLQEIPFRREFERGGG